MPKVFVHGNPECSAVWDLLVAELADRSVDDVVRLSPPGFGAPVPDGFEATMAGYHAQLAAIFWVAENHLFHAYALARLYAITKGLKQAPTPEEAQTLASRAVLAALAVEAAGSGGGSGGGGSGGGGSGGNASLIELAVAMVPCALLPDAPGTTAQALQAVHDLREFLSSPALAPLGPAPGKAPAALSPSAASGRGDPLASSHGSSRPPNAPPTSLQPHAISTELN